MQLDHVQRQNMASAISGTSVYLCLLIVCQANLVQTLKIFPIAADSPALSDYERQRLAKKRENIAALKALGLDVPDIPDDDDVDDDASLLRDFDDAEIFGNVEGSRTPQLTT